MLSRREFLRSSTLLALAPAVPGFLAQTARAAKAERDGRVLVVVQLDGGNDGINTVVPFADEGYAKCRKTLRLAPRELVKVDDAIGLHPSLREMGKMLEAGRLAVVQGVGYPNPSRSHFRSMAIWHTARPDEPDGALGWLGQGLDGAPPPARNAPASLLVGGGTLPAALRGRRAAAASLDRLDEFTTGGLTPLVTGGLTPRRSPDDLTAFVQRTLVDAYATSDRLAELTRGGSDSRYPSSGLGERLRLIAGLLKVGFGARVYYTLQGGYDTHSGQSFPHRLLLDELSAAVKAFDDDLTAAKLADRVLLLCFSEFGRTVKENGSAGTDHGTAGPVFLAGAGVKAGLHGQAPRLLDPDPKHGDLRVTVDFRRVYATVLEDWLGVPARTALGGPFERLPLLR
jgi:uncharacterized protein (DUF1501 family)